MLKNINRITGEDLQVKTKDHETRFMKLSSAEHNDVLVQGSSDGIHIEIEFTSSNTYYKD